MYKRDRFLIKDPFRKTNSNILHFTDSQCATLNKFVFLSIYLETNRHQKITHYKRR